MSRCLWYAPRLRFPLASRSPRAPLSLFLLSLFLSLSLSLSLLFSFSLSLLVSVLNRRLRCGKMVAAPDKLFVFSRSFPTTRKTGPGTSVLGCIRQADVVIHARILFVFRFTVPSGIRCARRRCKLLVRVFPCATFMVQVISFLYTLSTTTGISPPLPPSPLPSHRGPEY